MRKFDNFCAALNNLKDIYNYNEPYENVILTGLVALFGICFEQSWKAMKEDFYTMFVKLKDEIEDNWL